MFKKAFIVLVVTFFLSLALVAQQNPVADVVNQSMAQGRDFYQQAKYQEAVTSFRDIIVNPIMANARADAYFWLAKSLLAMGRLEDSARNFEYFLANYKNNANVPEATYQRGRILYLQSDYTASIQAFSKFLEMYKDSSYVPNAYYWTGESLYSMGQLDEALKMFQIVIQEFPSSYRVEAARYRVSLIDMSKRENQLLELLKWSHQENIRNLEEFQKREKVYDEAIRSYQQRIINLASDDFREEMRILQQKADTAQGLNDTAQSRINELNTQIRLLQEQITTLEKQRDTNIAQLKDMQNRIQKPVADALAEIDRRQKLLDAKEQALKLKEQILGNGDGK